MTSTVSRKHLSDTNSDNIPDTVTTNARRQEWDLDALGNWDSTTYDSGSAQTRSHNKQNQITSSGYTYDSNGNLTAIGSASFAYDAWNRLTARGTTFKYDALGRRISEETPPSTNPQPSTENNVHDLYYTTGWQVVQEVTYTWMIEEGAAPPPPEETQRIGPGRIGRGLDDLDGGDNGGDGSNSLTTGSFVPVYTSYIWSAGPGAYIDSMIARINNQYGTLYVQHDANFNVTAITNTSGAVVERFIYDAYGSATYLDANWSVDSSGMDYAWVYLNQGLRHEGESNTDDARNRVLLPALGRPAHVDPIRYKDGMNYYQWEQSNPVNFVDPMGLEKRSVYDDAINAYGVERTRQIGNDLQDAIAPIVIAQAATEGAADGGKAWAEGALPGQQFDDSDYYDANDELLGYSQLGGQISATAWLSALLAPAGPAGQVARWGSPPTQGCWVMTGTTSWRNWIMSGKLGTSPWNCHIAKLAPSQLMWPTGPLGWIKGLIGQRIIR